MTRFLRAALLILPLLLQGLGSALAAAPTMTQTAAAATGQGEHTAMPCHDDAESAAAAMPCCDDDSACRCTMACFGGGSAPLPGSVLSAVQARPHPANAASPPAPLPAHPHPLLRPPASAVS